MLQPIDTNIWHAVHAFSANGLPITTRMTVVRLPEGKLLVHSPIRWTTACNGSLPSLAA